MLKIRDDVDLKELEKFGFRKKEYYYELNFSQEGFDGLAIDLDSRQICDYSVGNNVSVEILYDLIKANLVAKE